MPLNASLHIETALKNEKTILRRAYCTQPFKIADITEDKRKADLRLMLMSSSPGILDGDVYDLKIDVGENAFLSLETQSYQRLFRMKNGASQRMAVSLKKGSRFTYLPHPVVPHSQSIFLSKNELHLEENCSLLWGEVMSCGRKLNGEVFQFSSYHSITEVFLKNKLVVKENLLLRPAEVNLAGMGHMEGFTHQATLLYIDDNVSVPTLSSVLLEELQADADTAFGVTALPVNGLLVRLLGHSAEQLFQLLKRTTLLLQGREAILNKTPVAHVA